MGMSGLKSGAAAWAAGHRLLATLAAIVIIAGLCAGGWYGWQTYQYRQSGEYAFERLRAALNPPDTAALAKMVDFNSISDDLAKAAAQAFPFYMAGPDQTREIRMNAQTALLRSFMEKPPSKSQTPVEESEEDLLKQPLYLIPPDLLEQLSSSLAYHPKNDTSGYLSASIENKLLRQPFSLMLGMERGPDGWKLSRLLNAQDLLAAVKDSMLKRHAAQRELFEKRNAATQKRMNSMLPIQSCTANAGLLSDQKTLLMVVHVLARNTGPVQINNMTVNCEISRGGKPIIQRYLNAAQAVPPGTDFSHRWNFELDGQSELGRRLLQGPLTCKASWQTLGPNSSEVLHMVEVPHHDLECDLPGHAGHPSGFCQIPLFRADEPPAPRKK